MISLPVDQVQEIVELELLDVYQKVNKQYFYQENVMENIETTNFIQIAKIPICAGQLENKLINQDKDGAGVEPYLSRLGFFLSDID